MSANLGTAIRVRCVAVAHERVWKTGRLWTVVGSAIRFVLCYTLFLSARPIIRRFTYLSADLETAATV